MPVNALVWLDVTLSGLVTGIHVRWYEGGEPMRHDETWDDELSLEEAQRLVEFVQGTAR